jgi:hypothetical protein
MGLATVSTKGIDGAVEEEALVAAEGGGVGEIAEAVGHLLLGDGVVHVGGEAPLAGKLEQTAEDAAGGGVGDVVVRGLVDRHGNGDEDILAKRIVGGVAGDGELVGAVADGHPLGLERLVAVEGEVGEETELRRELVVDAAHERLFARDLCERALVAAPDAGGEIEIVLAGVGEEAGGERGGGRGGGGAVRDVSEAGAERLAGGLEGEGDGLGVGEAVYGGLLRTMLGVGAGGEGGGVGIERGGGVGDGALEVVEEERAVLHAQRFAVAVAAAEGDVGLCRSCRG